MTGVYMCNILCTGIDELTRCKYNIYIYTRLPVYDIDVMIITII